MERVQKFLGRIVAIEDYFNPKAFALTFTVLLVLLVGWVLSVVVLYGTPTEKPHPTGKIMVTIDLPKVEAPSPENFAPRVDESSSEETPALHPDAALTDEGGAEALAADENKGHPHDAKPLEDPPPSAMEESVAGLTEDSVYGELPVIRKQDGMRPYDAYKAPFKLGAKTKGVIALVMRDYGLSDSMTNKVLADLPAGLTLVATPYAQQLQAKVSTARGRGQEVWMTLPLQSLDFGNHDTGPSTILSGLSDKQNLARLNTTLGRATGFVGVLSIGVPVFKEESREIETVLSAVTDRGLGVAWLDVGEKDYLKSLEKKPPAISFSRHIGGGGESGLPEQLAALEEIASQKGYVVAAFEPSPLVIEEIAKWAKALSGKQVQLAPLSYAIYQSSISSAQ